VPVEFVYLTFVSLEKFVKFFRRWDTIFAIRDYQDAIGKVSEETIKSIAYSILVGPH
jgi:hypothetical protein